MNRVTLQICDKGFWKPAVKLPKGALKGSSHGRGEYLITPKGQSAFKAYCDMDSFGGGWTVCYKTDGFVDIKSELKSTPRLGYRADCNHIPTAKGVASSSSKYRLLICYTSFYKGLMVSGYTDSCYKKCDHWCWHSVSPYFRSASSSTLFAGVAFDKNGHKPLGKRLICVAIR
ncbi:uncharacterized protein LOC124449072 [Xenia sp. Carnegie-2017]|uniref:uncharacterized protein LOC124449072 n=1 Tax=Xenia sp. Carnegie-2017 TaxID=2897299 RepID=UPI001F0419A3|nr:uncharacterized protein LOC124449072 [Xenia sp. Carnegie-2017]